MNVWAVMTIKNVFINVLSGSMIPLWFMPDVMRTVIGFTPFESIYFTPVQIYLGKIGGSDIILGFAKQIIWITALLLMGSVVWKKGQKKIVVQGG